MRRRLSKFSIVMVLWLTVLMLALIAVMGLERAGTVIMYTSAIFMGSALALFSLLVWGAVCWVKRMKEKNRFKGGAIIAAVLFMIGSMAFSVLLQLGDMMLNPYATISSPEGKQVLVLKMYDLGMGSEEDNAAMVERMDARLAGMVDENGQPYVVTEETGYPADAYGLIYTAYPKKAGFFFDATADSQGYIYRGMASQAEIKYEWTGEDSVRFYLENAEPGDSGEIILTFN